MQQLRLGLQQHGNHMTSAAAAAEAQVQQTASGGAEDALASSSDSSGGGAPPARQLSGRVAVLTATKSATLDVQEAGRSLAEYMTLPASQYSVLDAQRIERLDADTFRCYVGGLRFLGLEVEPVITVSVVVGERGPTVRLLSTELRGSKAVEAANERFDATMTNVVRWQESPAGPSTSSSSSDGSSGTSSSGSGSSKQLASDTEIKVQLQVPAWFLLPTAAIERAGSAVMAKVLDTAVPRFLQQLAVDYAAWAGGDETRQPLASGSLLDEVYEAPPLEEAEQGWD